MFADFYPEESFSIAGCVDAALFIYTLESRKLVGQLRENHYGVTINLDGLLNHDGRSQRTVGAKVKHVALSGNLEVVKTMKTCFFLNICILDDMVPICNATRKGS